MRLTLIKTLLLVSLGALFGASATHADVAPIFLTLFSEGPLKEFTAARAKQVQTEFIQNQNGEWVVQVRTYDSENPARKGNELSNYEFIFSERNPALGLSPDINVQRYSEDAMRFQKTSIEGQTFIPIQNSALVPDFDHSGRIRSLFRADPVLHPIHRGIPENGEITLSDPQREALFGTKDSNQLGLIQFYKNHLGGSQSNPFVGAIILPTGIGKTIVGLQYIQHVATLNGGATPLVVFVVENKQILRDIAKKFKGYAAPDSIVRLFGEETQSPLNENTRVILATRTTAHNRFDEILDFAKSHKGPTIFFRDEAHHTGKEGGQFQSMFDRFLTQMGKGDQILDLSATMWSEEEPHMVRRYKGNIATSFLTPEEYDRLIEGKDVPLHARVQLLRAIERGWLSPLTSLTFFSKDTEGQSRGEHLKTIYAEQMAIPKILGLPEGTIVDSFNPEEIPEDKMRALRAYIQYTHRPIIYSLVQDIYNQMLKDPKGRVTEFDRGLIFVPTILHAEIYKLVLEGLFQETNVEFRMAHSKMSSQGGRVVGENFDWLADLDSSNPRTHKFLINVAIAREGVDIKGINRIINISPTDSIKILIQILGRGARLAELKSGIRLSDWTGSYLKFFNQVPEEVLATLFRRFVDGKEADPRILLDGKNLSISDLISLELERVPNVLRDVLDGDLERLVERTVQEAKETPVEIPANPRDEPKEKEFNFKGKQYRYETEKILAEYGYGIQNELVTQERVDRIVETMSELNHWVTKGAPDHVREFLVENTFRLGTPNFWLEGQEAKNDRSWEKRILEDLRSLWDRGIYRDFERYGPGAPSTEDIRKQHRYFQNPDQFEKLKAYAEFHWLLGTNTGRALLARSPEVVKALSVSPLSNVSETAFLLTGSQVLINDPRWVRSSPELEEALERSNVIREALGLSILTGTPPGPNGHYNEVSHLRAMMMDGGVSNPDVPMIQEELPRIIHDRLIHNAWSAHRFSGLKHRDASRIGGWGQNETFIFLFRESPRVRFKVDRELQVIEQRLWAQDLMLRIAELRGREALDVFGASVQKPVDKLLGGSLVRPVLKSEFDHAFGVVEGRVFSENYDHTLLKEWVRQGQIAPPKTEASYTSMTVEQLEGRLVWMDGWRRILGDLERVSEKGELVDPELTKRYLEQTMRDFESRPGAHQIFASPEMEWLMLPLGKLELPSLAKPEIAEKVVTGDFIRAGFGSTELRIAHNTGTRRKAFALLPLLFAGKNITPKTIKGIGPTSIANLQLIMDAVRLHYPQINKVDFHALFGTGSEVDSKEVTDNILRASNPGLGKDGEFVALDTVRRRWLEIFDYFLARTAYQHHFGIWTSSLQPEVKVDSKRHLSVMCKAFL